MDNELGTPTLKDDKPNEPRRAFESQLRKTLGEAKAELGDLTPDDMREFQTAYTAAQDATPGIAKQLYMNWVQGRPFVKDSNPHRQVTRAKGKDGDTGVLQHYTNANGFDVYEPAAVSKDFLTGSYDRNAKQLLNQR
jgi:hypothetical protein